MFSKCIELFEYRILLPNNTKNHLHTMKHLLTALLALFIIQFTFSQNTSTQQLQNTETYLNSIRNDEAKLRQFLSAMPKGADLHHHYSGSVYAETYLEYVEKHDLWINRTTFAISDKQVPKGERSEWSRVSSLKADGYWTDIKVGIIESWSKLYFNYVSKPNDEHFFFYLRKV